MIYRPPILNNITSWIIFDDDQQIIYFLHSEDTFRGLVIEDEHHEAIIQSSCAEDNLEYSNTMPKNIIKLDRLFNLQDKFKKSINTKTNSLSLKYEAVNLDTE